MAALAAWASRATAGTPPLKVVTFAAAKPGDAAFRAAYQAAGIDHTRYEYNIDIVPHLPAVGRRFHRRAVEVPPAGLPGFHDLIANLERFDYQPVGTLQYIESNGQIVDDSRRAPDESRPGPRRWRSSGCQFAQIAMNHAIGCGSGYMSAIAPTGVCP